jgi:hypothetical protein
MQIEETVMVECSFPKCIEPFIFEVFLNFYLFQNQHISASNNNNMIHHRKEYECPVIVMIIDILNVIQLDIIFFILQPNDGLPLVKVHKIISR